jgi:hypothetical protein
MTDHENERARLAHRADVERDRLLRVLDALFGRHPIEQAGKRAKQIALPIAAIAVAGTSVALVVSSRKRRKHRNRDARRDTRIPAHLEIARNVLVSIATFAIAAFAKRYLGRLIARRA